MKLKDIDFFNLTVYFLCLLFSVSCYYILIKFFIGFSGI